MQPTSLGSDHFGFEPAEDESEPTQLCSAVPHYGGQAVVLVPKPASIRPSYYGGQAAVFVPEAAEDESEPSAVPSHYGGQAAVSVRLDDGLAADLKRTAQQYLRQAKGLDIILVMETTGRMQVAA